MWCKSVKRDKLTFVVIVQHVPVRFLFFLFRREDKERSVEWQVNVRSAGYFGMKKKIT